MKPRGLAVLAVGCGLLGGCAGLPDLERGKHGLQSGDLAAAERDLRPLAAEGYPEAQLRLAQLYAEWDDPHRLRQAATWYRDALTTNPDAARPLARVLMRLGDAESLNEAEKLLREADPENDPAVLATLIEFYTDFPERDRKGRVARLLDRAASIQTDDTQAAVIRWYRANADQERYAKELITHCTEARERAPECYVDLASHYRGTGDRKKLDKLIAAARNRIKNATLPVSVMERLGWALVTDEIPGPALPEVAFDMLSEAAKLSLSGRVRLARLIVEYPFLDPDGSPEKLLLTAVAQGSSDAALALGRLYMNGTSVPADPAKAERYFKQAARTEPAGHYYLGRLYRRGYLGRSDPVRAAEHFLIAARRGYRYADLALAQLFSDRRGVKPNYTNAYIFASLALRNEVPEAVPLLAEIKPQLTRAQLRQAEQVLSREVAVRETPLGAMQALAGKTASISPSEGKP